MYLFIPHENFQNQVQIYLFVLFDFENFGFDDPGARVITNDLVCILDFWNILIN